jgi:hypothetical protein
MGHVPLSIVRRAALPKPIPSAIERPGVHRIDQHAMVEQKSHHAAGRPFNRDPRLSPMRPPFVQLATPLAQPLRRVLHRAHSTLRPALIDDPDRMRLIRPLRHGQARSEARHSEDTPGSCGPAPTRRYVHRRGGNVGDCRTAKVAAHRRKRGGACSASWRSGDAPRAVVARIRARQRDAEVGDMTSRWRRPTSRLRVLPGFHVSSLGKLRRGQFTRVERARGFQNYDDAVEASRFLISATRDQRRPPRPRDR